MSKSAHKHAPPRGVWGHAPQKMFSILGPLGWVLMQSESVRAFMPASLIVIPRPFLRYQSF